MRTKHSSKPIRTLRRRRLALALVTALAAPMAMAQNLPQNGNVVSGTASVGPQVGNQMTITQTTKGAIIDWGSFNIGVGYGVTFDQQFGASSVILNRVIGSGYGPSPSSINGTLSSNGNVFIINPAGITFGNNAQVNVGGLVASTLWLSDADFNNGLTTGKYVFSGFNGYIGTDHQVRNDGDITAGAGGLSFVGNTLWNSGAITANGGNIAFGAGDSVTLDYFGDGLTQVTINVPPTIDSAIIQDRNGTMTADGGKILLRTAATAGGTGGAIFASGSLRAQSIANVNGRIELTSAGGLVMVGAPGTFSDASSPFTYGSIDVSGSGAGQTGGSVLISGNNVLLVNDDPTPLAPTYPASVGSSIDATGYSGGGNITITTTGSIAALELTRIDARAISSGNGGNIDLLATGGNANLYGDIFASGGKVSGNGGRIRIGARDGINQNYGYIDASADAGNGGQIGLITSAGDIHATNLDAHGFANGGSIVGTASGNIDLYGYANASGLNGNGGSISFNAQGIFRGLGTLDASGGIDGGNISLTGAGVDFNSAIAYGSTGHGGTVSVTADNIYLVSSSNSINVQGETGGGSIDLFARNNFVLGESSSLSADTGSSGNGGSIHLYAGNSLVVYGDLSAHGVDGGGSIYTGSGGGIDLNGIGIDAGTLAGVVGTWTIAAPQMAVLNGSTQGTVGTGPVPATTTDIQDGDLNNAFATGTNIVLQANAGDVQFNGAQILAAYSSPLFLHVNATGAIYGAGFSIGSGGGALEMLFNADSAGGNDNGGYIDFSKASLSSNGGLIAMYGQSNQAAGFATGYANGISLSGVDIGSAGGGVVLRGHSSGSGSSPLGRGIQFANGSGITTTSGAITLVGIGNDMGLSIDSGQFTTASGHIDLRGRGLSVSSSGLLIGSGVSITTNGGGIDLSGEGGSGTGLSLGVGSTVDAGNSLIMLRAGNDGSTDAINILGAVHSGTGVSLRPGGVDANGGLTERVNDIIALGGGTGGFALSAGELAMIDAPLLVIGSSLQAGAIHVLGAISRNGNLTLQNNGGSGGIDIQAALAVGNGTLALSSGGSITQTSAGAITAHSLLANAGGDVLLANAQNNVAATTLAGSAGGAFQFQDVDALAIGNVSAIGFDASTGGLASLGANGINAGGDVVVRNLAGDMTLNSNVSGANIDLVTAGRLQNLGGASLIASGDWRVWADTWVGETRGGLAGSGNLPNLYGCAFQGSCGVTVPTTDNHFIYVQQPTAMITFDNFSREYGLPNPVFTFTVTGAILGDTAANVASGTASTSATIGSDVGNYAITGAFTSAAGYRIQLMPGTLGITPAMLFFTADPAVRYLGSPNPNFTGTVTGFRNGDSVGSVFGTGNIWSSPAGYFAQIGFYPINGGTSAKNYVFSQAPGNATALQIIPLPQLSGIPFEQVHEAINTYVYDRNFGGAPVCALNASIDDQKLASTGDELSNEWSKVRSRPNLTNCFDTERNSGCGNF
ncbi:MBG domain-containing protein [Thermomonas sp.]|uniref:beta strand repeat-containing protein n=1 Tax=Thermomonas sp. TaxID=1971895 RepID=UPI0024897EF9|nr:MBG domain-containing protein [Thermomonas sp.]MDI1252922.1 MBG domain-containing protein [Thermomonas sp.]